MPLTLFLKTEILQENKINRSERDVIFGEIIFPFHNHVYAEDILETVGVKLLKSSTMLVLSYSTMIIQTSDIYRVLFHVGQSYICKKSSQQEERGETQVATGAP